MEGKFIVYENWRAEHKAVVHRDSCGHANEAHIKISDNWLINNHSPNGRWFGYFFSLKEALAFSILLPNRKIKLCKTCLNDSFDEIQ